MLLYFKNTCLVFQLIGIPAKFLEVLVLEDLRMLLPEIVPVYDIRVEDYVVPPLPSPVFQ